MRPNIEALIFDVDGTLVDTNAAHVEVWRRTFSAFALSVAPERIACEVGQGGDRLVHSILGPERARLLGPQLHARWPETYTEYLRSLPPGHPRAFPNASELIRALRARGVPMAVATSNSRELMAILRARVDLELPEVIVTGEAARATKPAPDIVLAAAAQLGVRAERCVYVGDTPYDAMAARAARMRAFGVLTGGHTEAALRAAGAERVWSDVGAMYGDLDTLLG
jgi:HAD superfamily hydrolase (TIGR01509 family)